MMRDVNEIILNEVDIKISQIDRYTMQLLQSKGNLLLYC